MSGTTELTFPLAPRRRLIGLAFGMVQSARRGTGSDVAGSRPYQPGDDVDTIDWAASARLSSARGRDEFIVRERYAEEAPRVVIVCDRRPAMALYPPELPWLSKPRAMVEAGTLIADSAAKARGLVGYLDFATANGNGAGPFWRPPHAQQEFWRAKESHLRFPAFGAPEDNLDRAFEFIAPHRRSLPAGTFVFVLSDFIAGPSEEAWAKLVELPWEVVPVVIQDPVWEQSFPDVASVVVPLLDPRTGRLKLVRLSRKEARERRARHEARLAGTLAELEALGLDPVLVSSASRDDIYTRFLEWVDLRQEVVRERW
ncbi:MAG: DUF58 domain-containing protein [Actinomycetota bacterium]|nr:DUF58 domain-containing protein [Actinomycetota bacterium]